MPGTSQLVGLVDGDGAEYENNQTIATVTNRTDQRVDAGAAGRLRHSQGIEQHSGWVAARGIVDRALGGEFLAVRDESNCVSAMG